MATTKDYIERLREYFLSIRLDPAEYDEYCQEVTRLVNEVSTSDRKTKPSDIHQSITRFVIREVKAPDGDRLNVYLIAIDNLEIRSRIAGTSNRRTAIDVLSGLDSNDLWWKQLVRNVTADYTIDPDMIAHLQNRQVKRALKLLFAVVLRLCRHSDPHHFARNIDLTTVNIGYLHTSSDSNPEND